MNVLDLFSGISAPSVAWHPLGWRTVAFAEVEPFPCAVLAHHYPDVPNWGDVTQFEEWPDACHCDTGREQRGTSSEWVWMDGNRNHVHAEHDGSAHDRVDAGRGERCNGTVVDLLVGGSPCQAFSVAGLRGGLADPRGNLTLTYLAVVAKYRPRWVVWENVPGVLSIDGGRVFGAFLGGLGQLGYGFAYRVLDAQHFGVPQRRRRVFVVGHLGDWRRAAAVLFERHSLSWDSAPRREAGEGTAGDAARSVAIRGRNGTPQAELGDDKANAILTPNGGRGGIGVGAVIAPTIPARTRGGGGLGTDFDCDGGLVAGIASTGDISHCLNAGGMGRQDYETETLIAHPLRAQAQASHRADSDTYVTHTLRAAGFDASEDGTGRGTPLMPVAFHHNAQADQLPRVGRDTSISDSITCSQGAAVALPQAAVRRLTPKECERLQGFPDGYTLIPMHKRNAAAEQRELDGYAERTLQPPIKWSADGPRYKALGNSMAVPVVSWIGSRIAQVDAL